MMTFFKKLCLTTLLAASSIGSAVAAPISVNDTHVASQVAIVPTPVNGTPYSFIFDITDMFVPQFDELTTALLTFRFSDPGQGSEKYKINLGGVQNFVKDGNNNVSNGNNISLHYVELNDAALADLNEDGLLKIVLSVNAGGSFMFDGVTVLAEGDAGTKVPEPFTLALMGIALAGVGAARRRK
jgi:hypothetical protein